MAARQLKIFLWTTFYNLLKLKQFIKINKSLKIVESKFPVTILLMSLLYAVIGIGSLWMGYPEPAIGLLTMSVGGFLNLIAILGNSNKMPVFLKHANEKKWLENSRVHSILNKKTRFKCLCDLHRQGIKDGFSISSIGDWLLMVGKNITIFTILGYYYFALINS